MNAPSKVAVRKKYDDLPDGLKKFLEHFPSLADDYPWEVVLGYLHSQIELAQNKAVHGVIVRKHRVNSELARSTVDKYHMTRTGFRELYKKISGTPVSQAAIEKSKEAESVRDKILHGKRVTDREKRSAVLSALEYAGLLNEQVFSDAGFKPFGDMRGFKGRAEPLDKGTSRWLLIGMGLISHK
jgi:hypothetical protein